MNRALRRQLIIIDSYYLVSYTERDRADPAYSDKYVRTETPTIGLIA